MPSKKKLKFFDILALAFSSVFSLELIASQAALGPSLVFCFITLGCTYFLSHGFMCAELGSAYPDQGGIYVWVKNAFGDKWAARTTWWYWINVAGFIPATAVIMGAVLKQLFIPDLPIWSMVVFCILCVWLVVLLNCIDLQHAKWLPIISSICKVIVCIVLIGGAIYALITRGSVTEFTVATMVPHIDMSFLALIPVFVYGITGYDLVSCSAGEMENPRKDVPKVVFTSGVLTIVFYIISATSLLIVLPSGSVNEASGLFDAFVAIFGNGPLVLIMGIITFIGFLGYIFGWALGGNKVALEAGQFGELPAIFAKTNKAHAPVGSAVLLGLTSTALLVFYGFTATSDEGLFWTLLAFTSIIFFLPYIMLSFTFVKLRKSDPDAVRPFRVPGGHLSALLVAGVQLCFLLISAIFFLIPPEGENPLVYVGTLVVGILLSIVLGEIIITKSMAASVTVPIEQQR